MQSIEEYFNSLDKNVKSINAHHQITNYIPNLDRFCQLVELTSP